MRSALSILISTIRNTVEITDAYERLRLAGADEFTQARARRMMLDAMAAASITADMAEKIEARSLQSVEDQLASVRDRHLHETSPPDPPAAA